MKLGAFSISLAVKALQNSRSFYEKLGFEMMGGEPAEGWVILNNGGHVIGLFQGMFDKNMLTFNPGWDQAANELDTFTDVRDLQRQLDGRGVKFTVRADESTAGPASFFIENPDGNVILVDQYV